MRPWFLHSYDLKLFIRKRHSKNTFNYEKISIISFNFTSKQHTFLHDSEVEKRSRCISINSPVQESETSNAFIHNSYKNFFFFKSHLLFQSPTSYCQLYIPGTEKHPLKPLKCWIIILWLMWLTLIRSIPASQAATLWALSLQKPYEHTWPYL